MNERIKELRKMLSLNQTDFAARLSLSQSAVAGYESGIRTPLEPIIKSICREFGVNEKWLRTGEGDMFDIPDDEDAAALADMLSNPDDEMVKSLLGSYKKYMQLNETNKKVFLETLRELAKGFLGE